MNEFLFVFEVWVAIFVMVTGFSTLLRRKLPDLRPIYGTLIMTAVLVPTMVYLIIPGLKFLNEPAQETEMTMQPSNDTENRYQRGLANLKAIDGQAGEQVIHSLQGIAPDMATYVIEYPFGDIYNRPGLDLKSREIATIAALTAMGNAEPQLKVHIKAGLNVGLLREEIVEIMMQMSVYSGFPSALNGLKAAKEVFAEIDEASE